MPLAAVPRLRRGDPASVEALAARQMNDCDLRIWLPRTPAATGSWRLRLAYRWPPALEGQGRLSRFLSSNGNYAHAHPSARCLKTLDDAGPWHVAQAPQLPMTRRSRRWGDSADEHRCYCFASPCSSKRESPSWADGPMSALDGSIGVSARFSCRRSRASVASTISEAASPPTARCQARTFHRGSASRWRVRLQPRRDIAWKRAAAAARRPAESG